MKSALGANSDDAFDLLESTHIVKPECPPNRNAVVVESSTLDLAKLCGLQVCEHSVVNVGDSSAFITPRFDRRFAPDGLGERLRVEDFTQSLGVSRDVKYDVETETVIAMLKHVDPTCSLCYDWLAQFAFNVMVCNADAHAKNYSLLLEVEKVKLSPLCDGLATWYWPQYSKALAMLAMSVNDVWFTNEITLSDWEALARQNGLAVDKALDVVKRIATGVAAHAQSAFAEIPGLANIVLEANRLLLEDLRCAYSVNHGEE
ncbi:MAG: HipA domain-containing protein [Coriobacteriia bacterium]|nr:HipA domain-containing protein [Coriobacteriia bacterium]